MTLTSMLPSDYLKKYFGYDSFRPPQDEIVAQVLAGHDALVLMPTGGGKSLCYQLPALMMEGITLVISPLISLMKDQVDGLNAAGIAAACLNSSLPQGELVRTQNQVLEGKIKILYIAPERLGSSAHGGFIRGLPVSLVAIDEAHCISEWGHDFRPDYRNLHSLREIFPKATILALTATATPQVRDDILRQLKLQASRVFVSSFDRPNLTYSVLQKQKAFPQLLGLLKARRHDSVIIYRFSKKSTEELAEQLRERGFSARAYHAGLDPQERSRIQEGFIRDDIRIVVATIAFGMGINKPNVRLVVHYDLPKSVEGYYQETGRAGRDGLPSECVLFFSAGDRWKHMFFINRMPDPKEKSKAARKIDEVVRYAAQGVCRRKYLLAYFGEKQTSVKCDGCDTCVPRQRTETKFASEFHADIEESSGLQLGHNRSRNSSAGSERAAVQDAALFEHLRALRKKLADEHNWPAYVIFGDKSLIDMANAKPTTLVAFSKLYGVGAKKLETFGEIFLRSIREYENSERPTAKPAVREGQLTS